MKTYEGFQPVFPHLGDWSLPRLLEVRADTDGDRTYLVLPEEHREVTFADAFEMARRVAAGLRAAGGQPGDRLLIMAPNSLAYIALWFGSACAGMVEVPMNTAYLGAILEHQIGIASPTMAAITPEFAARVVASEAARRSIRHVTLIAERADAAAEARALQSAGYSVTFVDALLASEPRAVSPVGPSTLASILFTSGTTGPSKGVMNPYGQVHLFGEQVASLMRLDRDDRLLSVGPLFHANAQFLSVYAALVASCAVVVRRRFSASNWIDWSRADKATVANLVGVMMSFVHAQPERPDDAENPLRCVLTAPTPWDIVGDFQQRFGIECVTEDYGSTEVALPVMTPYGVERPRGSSGLLLGDWYDAKIADSETDREVEAGQVGELLLRSSVPWTTSLGYFGAPEATVAAQRNQWIHTGDAMRRDYDGWFYFVDRVSDSIRRRGENISSYEVEEPIRSHPAVADCAVVAVPAQVGGEDEVMAVVVLAPGATLDAALLWQWCDERIPSFATPRFVKFVDELPRTPSEKVQKARLRQDGTAGAVDRLAGDLNEFAGSALPDPHPLSDRRR